jgi:sensitive to high expression protein 9, mitochondrial
LGLNLLVFILAILIVEPWKRRRLAQTFEKRIQELSEETRQLVDGGIQNLLRHIEQQEELLNTLRELSPDENQTPALEPVVDDSPEPMPDDVRPTNSFMIEHKTILMGLGCAILGAVSSQAILSLL